MPKQLMLRSE